MNHNKLQPKMCKPSAHYKQGFYYARFEWTLVALGLATITVYAYLGWI